MRYPSVIQLFIFALSLVSVALTAEAAFERTTAVPLAEVPTTVKDTIGRYDQGGRVDEIRRAVKEDGRVFYEATVSLPTRQKVELEVRQSGRLTRLQYRHGSAEDVSLTSTPEAVQKTIQELAGDAKVRRIVREFDDATPFYEATATTADHHLIKMNIGEDGALHTLQTERDPYWTPWNGRSH